ncbi:MAG: Flp pilus assembly complex ATPase component TadA, partial [Acidobacteria bacterium]|nr:Flp pilus assembly complex ATPase component TadA [Acidobacteriota bacterium]
MADCCWRANLHGRSARTHQQPARRDPVRRRARDARRHLPAGALVAAGRADAARGMDRGRAAVLSVPAIRGAHARDPESPRGRGGHGAGRIQLVDRRCLPRRSRRAPGRRGRGRAVRRRCAGRHATRPSAGGRLAQRPGGLHHRAGRVRTSPHPEAARDACRRTLQIVVMTPSSTPVTPGTAAMDALLSAMVQMKASDLHLSAGNAPTVRHDGEMTPVPGCGVLSAADTERLLLSIATPRAREEFARRHDADFAYEIPGVGRFRGNLFMDRKGPGGVFRIIPTGILSAETLGLSQEVLDLCRLPKGLVLVTGPTGSGKSTTLAALVDYVNRTRPDHII